MIHLGLCLPSNSSLDTNFYFVYLTNTYIVLTMHIRSALEIWKHLTFTKKSESFIPTLWKDKLSHLPKITKLLSNACFCNWVFIHKLNKYVRLWFAYYYLYHFQLLKKHSPYSSTFLFICSQVRMHKFFSVQNLVLILSILVKLVGKHFHENYFLVPIYCILHYECVICVYCSTVLI